MKPTKKQRIYNRKKIFLALLCLCCIFIANSDRPMQQQDNNSSLTDQQGRNATVAMSSKLDPYCSKIQQWRLEGLTWRAVAVKLKEERVKATPDEVFRYMRNARKRAERILAEVAPLQDLEKKRAAGVAQSPSVPTSQGAIVSPIIPPAPGTAPQDKPAAEDLLTPRPTSSEDDPLKGWGVVTPESHPE
jgi:hypothetical protein